MTRIVIPDEKKLTDEQRVQYDRFPANLTLGLLATTCSAIGYLSLGASFPEGKLKDKDREMVILRVGALSKSAYEKMQHYQMALDAGWTEKELEGIENGISENQRESAILKFTEECVKNVKVSDETFAAVKHIYDDQQIAELTLMIGHYMMTARFLETLEIPLDSSATSWGAQYV